MMKLKVIGSEQAPSLTSLKLWDNIIKKRKDNMKVKELIKELKTYDGETDFAVKLVVDPHDSKKDLSLKWIGEIDTSLLDQGYIEFGVERII